MAIIPDEDLVAFVGELLPGEKGFLPIDANGAPAGPATKAQTVAPSVYVRAGFTDQNEPPLMTETGAPITDDMVPLHSVVYEFDENAVPPVLSSIEPMTAELNSPDFTLRCLGTGFTPSSKIYFAGQPEPIEYISAEEVTTIVKPSLPWGPATVEVKVDNSEALEFTFTEPAARSRQKAPPPRGSKTS